MSRKRRQPTRRSNQAVPDGARRAIPGWIWLLLGMVMGLGLAVFLMIAGLMPRHRDADRGPVPNAEAQGPADVSELSAADPDAAGEPEQKPRYDFYTVLPEMEVVVPEEEISKRVERREERDESKGPYVLQVGSFRDFEDADRTKAELALMGIIAEVKTVNINDSTWHRVRIGPFESVREMDQTRRRLQEARYEVMVLTEKG